MAAGTPREGILYLEDAFLVHAVWLTTESERRCMSHPRKIYPIDPGLFPLFDRSGRMQPSKALDRWDRHPM